MSDKFIDRDQAVRKGQAYNLAIMSACAQGKINDNEFICKEFLRHYQFANLLQKASVDQLTIALNNPELIEAITRLNKCLEK